MNLLQKSLLEITAHCVSKSQAYNHARSFLLSKNALKVPVRCIGSSVDWTHSHINSRTCRPITDTVIFKIKTYKWSGVWGGGRFQLSNQSTGTDAPVGLCPGRLVSDLSQQFLRLCALSHKIIKPVLKSLTSPSVLRPTRRKIGHFVHVTRLINNLYCYQDTLKLTKSLQRMGDLIPQTPHWGFPPGSRWGFPSLGLLAFFLSVVRILKNMPWRTHRATRTVSVPRRDLAGGRPGAQLNCGSLDGRL